VRIEDSVSPWAQVCRNHGTISWIKTEDRPCRQRQAWYQTRDRFRIGNLPKSLTLQGVHLVPVLAPNMALTYDPRKRLKTGQGSRE